MVHLSCRQEGSLGQGKFGRGPGMTHSRAWTDDPGWQGWTTNNRCHHDPSSSWLPRVLSVPGDGSGICPSILTMQAQPFFGLLNEDVEAVVVVQSLSRVRLSATPWTQVSLSIIISRSLLKLMSTESMMSSNHLILCRPLLLPSIFPSIRVFSNESALCLNEGVHSS